MPKPNILYIHSHDTGRFIQPYGHAVETPHLQALAEDGVLFRHAFSAAPTCSPSRASLLTGLWPHSSGAIGLAHRGFSLRDYDQHLVSMLRKAGYFSALVGVQHVAGDAAEIGYDLVSVQSQPAEHAAPGSAEFLQNAPSADAVASAAVEFLNDAPPHPFFLSVGFYETHREFQAPDSSEDSAYCLVPPTLPDMPEIRRDMAGFKASARLLDSHIGRVLKALDVTGIRDNTIVICTTDHGLAFPGMKCTLTDHGLGVMLIMRGPGGFAGGRVCEGLVSQIDLYPTICELLELDAPARLQGRSIMPLIRGEADEINSEIFAEVNYHAAYEPQRAIRTQRWKYTRRFDDRQTPVLPNIDDSPGKQVWLQYDYQTHQIKPEQLFDLIFDPNESRNLVDEPSVTPVLEDMRGRLERWMKATDDPLLRGPVAAPPAATVNDVDGISPGEPTVSIS